MAVLPKSLNVLRVGLGWDTYCDIDSSIILMNDKNELEETIYFGNKRGKNEAVIHFGDNLTGQGSGDDETIEIFLNKIS